MQIFENLGSEDRELQSYRKLERILHSIAGGTNQPTTRKALTSLPSVQQVCNAWLFQIGQILQLSQATLTYYERSEQKVFTKHYKAHFDWDPEQLAACQSRPQCFAVSGDSLTFRLPLVGSGHLFGGLRRAGTSFSPSELGLLGETVQCLREIVGWCRRLNLEELKTRALSGKTMVMEVRPNNLYYNLLYNCHRITPYNHSSTILSLEYGTQSTVIAAELLKFEKAKSSRIGYKIPLTDDHWQILIGLDDFYIFDYASPNGEDWLQLIELLYRGMGINLPQSLLVVPVAQSDKGSSMTVALLLLADQRQDFFTNIDGCYAAAVVGTAAPIIYNSIHFGERLDLLTEELESKLMSSINLDTNLHSIAMLLEHNSDAALCQLHFLRVDDEHEDRDGTDSNPETSVLSRGGRTEELRLSSTSTLFRELCIDGKTLISKDLSAIDDFDFPSLLEEFSLKSIIATPIRFQDRR